MKVGDLRKLIKGLPDDMDIEVRGDPSGRGIKVALARELIQGLPDHLDIKVWKEPKSAAYAKLIEGWAWIKSLFS